MATSPEQRERSAAYQTFQRLLNLWPPAGRLSLLTGLLRNCPYAAAKALLLHRLKDEHLRERRMPPAARRYFGASTLMPIARQHLDHAADPRQGLDLLLSALNLCRFMLSDCTAAYAQLRASQAAAGQASDLASAEAPTAAAPSAGTASAASPPAALHNDLRSRAVALPPSTSSSLRREVLEPLDGHLRRCMDATWAEIANGEREPSPPESLGEARVHFTQLQMALDVLDRVLALCKEHEQVPPLLGE